MFKVNNKNTMTTSWRRDVIVNFEYISHFFLGFLLLALNKQMLAGLYLTRYLQISLITLSEF